MAIFIGDELSFANYILIVKSTDKIKPLSIISLKPKI